MKNGLDILDIFDMNLIVIHIDIFFHFGFGKWISITDGIKEIG
jgi:hypothetical protein